MVPAGRRYSRSSVWMGITVAWASGRCWPNISHRRLDPILLGRHPAGGETAVGLLQRGGKDGSARLQQTCISWRKRDDRLIGCDDDFRLAALIGDLQNMALGRAGDAGDGGIGHQAVRGEIPRTLALPRSAQGLWKDQDLDRMQFAVGALGPGRADIVAGFDVGEALLDDG